jgi:hypothetical protein
MQGTWTVLRVMIAMALFIGFLVAGGSAKPFYVDAVGGSDAGAGTSPALAWKTLGFAGKYNFNPGDSLLLKRGCRWMEGFVAYSCGSPKKPFYIGAYGSGAAPVVNDSTDTIGYGIELIAQWVVVESLMVKNGFYGGIFMTRYADSSIVRYCEVTASGTGVEVQGRHCLVTGNYLHDMTMVLNEPGNTGDYGATGVLLENSCNEICNNRMVRCIAPCYEGGTDGGVIELYGTPDTCLIHDNIGIGCAKFTEVGGGSAKGTRMYYNISVNNGQVVCIHLNDQFASTVQDFRMENNTIVDTTTGGTPNWTLIGFIGTVSPGMFLFRNNIVFVKNFSYIVNASSADSGWAFTHTNNLYFLDSSMIRLNMTLCTGEEAANPQFVNYADTNFHLKPGSPAIGAGLALGYTLDFYSTAVPPQPSLGAVQYISTALAPFATSRAATAAARTPAAFLGHSGCYVAGVGDAAAFTLSGRRVPLRAAKSNFPLAP